MSSENRCSERKRKKTSWMNRWASDGDDGHEGEEEGKGYMLRSNDQIEKDTRVERVNDGSVKLFLQNEKRCMECKRDHESICVLWLGKKNREVIRCENCVKFNITTARCRANLRTASKYLSSDHSLLVKTRAIFKNAESLPSKSSSGEGEGSGTNGSETGESSNRESIPSTSTSSIQGVSNFNSIPKNASINTIVTFSGNAASQMVATPTIRPTTTTMATTNSLAGFASFCGRTPSQIMNASNPVVKDMENKEREKRLKLKNRLLDMERMLEEPEDSKTVNALCLIALRGIKRDFTELEDS